MHFEGYDEYQTTVAFQPKETSQLYSGLGMDRKGIICHSPFFQRYSACFEALIERQRLHRHASNACFAAEKFSAIKSGPIQCRPINGLFVSPNHQVLRRSKETGIENEY